MKTFNVWTVTAASPSEASDLRSHFRLGGVNIVSGTQDTRSFEVTGTEDHLQQILAGRGQLAPALDKK